MTSMEINRRERINDAIKVYDKEPSKKTLPIEYREKETLLKVIRVSPDLLLLNPENSRLKAQLVDHPDADIVLKDPYSIQSQNILADLLQKTDKFEQLKNELKEFGQIDPGVITRDGVLRNGNTRVAALRLLNAEGVDVAVMPDDANEDDYLNLEMSLQMRKLTHQDYTFTNQLLLIKKYLDYGHDKEKLAKKMNWLRNKEKKYKENMQLIDLVEEIRAIPDGKPIAYKEFDDKSEHLKNLNESYQSLLRDDPVEAERLKYARICAIFLGINKDRTRQIDSGFFEEHIIPRLNENLGAGKLIRDHSKTKSPSDGLDDILGENDDESIDLKSLAKTIANSNSEGTIQKDLDEEHEELQKVLNQATEAEINKAKRENFLSKPSDVLHDIREELEQVVENFGDALMDKSFDATKFSFNLKKVAKAIERLTVDFDKFQSKK